MWFLFFCFQFGFKYFLWTVDFLTVITYRIASGFNMSGLLCKLKSEKKSV